MSSLAFNYSNTSRYLLIILGLMGITIVGILIGGGVSFMPLQSSIIIIAAMGILVASLINWGFAMFFLVCCMLLSPEYIIGNLTGHDIVIRIEDVLLILLGMVWVARAAVDNRARKTVGSPLNSCIILFSVLFIFSTIRGIANLDISALKGIFYILKYLEYYVIYFFVINTVKTKQQIRMYMAAFILTFIIVDLYAASQIGHVPRVSAPFQTRSQEPNTLGGYQVLMLSIVMGLILTLRSKILKIFLIGVALFTLLPLLYTLSRCSYMALVASYFAFIWFYKPRRLLLIGIFIFLTVITVLFMPNLVRNRLQDTVTAQATQVTATEKVFGVPVGPSASARIQSWKIMYDNWHLSPFFGYGITGKGFIDGEYICMLTELGAIGFLAFILLLWNIYRRVFMIYRQTKDQFLKGLALGFLAGHFGMIIHALTANTFIIQRIMEPYWFLLGMIMVIPIIENEQSPQNSLPLSGEG